MKKQFLLGCVLIISLSIQAQKKPEGLFLNAKAPNFKVLDQHKNEVHLKKLVKEKNVVLIFYRGYWCPYCNLYLKNLQDSLSLIIKKGATVIAVTPESLESIDKTESKTSVDFSIISDSTRSIMKQYGVEFQVDETTKERYKKFGVDFSVINADKSDYLPIPATYIINKEQKIVYRFFDPNYKKRASVAEILEKL